MVALVVAAALHCDVVITPVVLRLLSPMFEDAGRGFRQKEEAAFLVIEDGHLALLRWPADGEGGTARWFGPIPIRALAIVHTHPNWQPLPSRIDRHTAAITHLPVYVITRNEISKTAGGAPQVVLNRDWR